VGSEKIPLLIKSLSTSLLDLLTPINIKSLVPIQVKKLFINTTWEDFLFYFTSKGRRAFFDKKIFLKFVLHVSYLRKLGH